MEKECHCNPLQYSCLENPKDRGVRQATVHGVARVGHDLATKPPPPSLLHTPLPFVAMHTLGYSQATECPSWMNKDKFKFYKKI